ncbi:hypothetical protein CLAVI_000500 [Candidatus Clavichlamydia salmonicola]|uniref:hypothetical protein n=1 Tax=Candidatus Clavichlamydia salmonicola TaxID=469812 RepID=UPI00189114DD|nr:hypothetical protein [Candidatus Clavichlamydia salmonicola]MBF5050878.1 hypothetical protein [Candidatus Clavichlamydia salmonicola]
MSTTISMEQGTPPPPPPIDREASRRPPSSLRRFDGLNECQKELITAILMLLGLLGFACAITCFVINPFHLQKNNQQTVATVASTHSCQASAGYGMGMGVVSVMAGGVALGRLLRSWLIRRRIIKVVTRANQGDEVDGISNGLMVRRVRFHEGVWTLPQCCTRLVRRYTRGCIGSGAVLYGVTSLVMGILCALCQVRTYCDIPLHGMSNQVNSSFTECSGNNFTNTVFYGNETVVPPACIINNCVVISSLDLMTAVVCLSAGLYLCIRPNFPLESAPLVPEQSSRISFIQLEDTKISEVIEQDEHGDSVDPERLGTISQRSRLREVDKRRRIHLEVKNGVVVEKKKKRSKRSK